MKRNVELFASDPQRLKFGASRIEFRSAVFRATRLGKHNFCSRFSHDFQFFRFFRRPRLRDCGPTVHLKFRIYELNSSFDDIIYMSLPAGYTEFNYTRYTRGRLYLRINREVLLSRRWIIQCGATPRDTTARTLRRR